MRSTSRRQTTYRETMASTPKAEKHAGKITTYPLAMTEGERARENERARERRRERETVREGAYATSVRDRATFLSFLRSSGSLLKEKQKGQVARSCQSTLILLIGAAYISNSADLSKAYNVIGGVNPTTLPDAKRQKHMCTACPSCTPDFSPASPEKLRDVPSRCS